MNTPKSNCPKKSKKSLELNNCSNCLELYLNQIQNNINKPFPKYFIKPEPIITSIINNDNNKLVYDFDEDRFITID